jgi:hypothetical protein
MPDEILVSTRLASDDAREQGVVPCDVLRTNGVAP